MTPKKSTDDIEVEIEGEDSTLPEVHVEGEERQAAEEAPPVEKKEDEDVEGLRQQLRELTEARNISNQRAAEAEARAREAAQREASYRANAAQSGYESVLTALGAAEIEIEAAKADIASSGMAGDFVALAEAQDRLAAARSRYTGLEVHKQQYEYQQQHPQVQQRQQTVGEHVDSDPRLSSQEKEWIKAHPDVMTDQVKNYRLNSAYYEALDKGLERNSKEYFEFIEDRLGYRKSEPPKREDNPAMVAAPPSRSGGGGPTDKGPRSYTMTKEEAEIAKASGISPAEYVLQREKLRELKKQGMYTGQP